MSHRPTRLALAAVLATAAALVALPTGGAVPPDAAASPSPVRYRPPVHAPVVDTFRPPPHPYGPGNRGLEYATTRGTQVRAVAVGQVVFAGPVGGRLVVSVAHPDGLRSSLTGLATVRVAAGTHVAAGSVVGTSGASLHLGIRRGVIYLDPAALFSVAGSDGRVHLVPVSRCAVLRAGASVLGAPRPVSSGGCRSGR